MGLGAMASGALAASPLGGLLGLTKARLNVYKPKIPGPNDDPAVRTSGTPKVYEFDYNPDKLVFHSKMEIAEAGTNSKSTTTQPGGPKPETTKFDLMYSIFEVGDLLAPKLQFNDLGKLKNELLALTQPHKDTKDSASPHPPLVEFSWGDLITEPAMVTEVTVTYTHMLPNGAPVRMTAEVTLQTTWKEKQGTNPTSGGRTNRKTHTLLAGETLAGVAYAELNDASLWRAIAEENEIDDPMRLAPGSVLLLPSMED